MGKHKNIRLVLVAAIVLLIAFSIFRGSRGTRLKLPVGPVKPEVCLGGAHGLILSGDGSLWSWGSDFLGWPVLGSGTTSTNTQTTLRRIGRDTNWIGISASASLNLAIKSDGTLWAWGQNIHGQFGLGTRQPVSSSVPIPAASGNDWKAAAAGGSHAFSLKQNGTLWAWGNNWAGQLGIGSTNDSLMPAQIGTATNWVKVRAGSLRGAAFQSDGSLWVWGDNPAFSNQVSRNDRNLLSPTRFSPDTNWVDASFGSDLLLAIKSDGTLWAWGRNAHVFTGITNSPASPTRVGTNSDWKSCSASEFGHYAVLFKKDGSIWTMESSHAPGGSLRLTQIKLQADVVAIAGGGRGAERFSPLSGVALTREGEVWTWGKEVGNPAPANVVLRGLANAARWFKVKNNWDNPKAVVHNKPWLLPNIDPDAPISR